MAKPKPKWLKLDKVSRVRVKVGAKQVEVRVIVPAERVRIQLQKLGK